MTVRTEDQQNLRKQQKRIAFLLKSVDHLNYVSVDQETWRTIQVEGLDQEQDSSRSSQWEMARLGISRYECDGLRKLHRDTVNFFNDFDIALKDAHSGKLIDLIDYDQGIVKIVEAR